jgi:hypothetical protein
LTVYWQPARLLAGAQSPVAPFNQPLFQGCGR